MTEELPKAPSSREVWHNFFERVNMERRHPMAMSFDRSEGARHGIRGILIGQEIPLAATDLFHRAKRVDLHIDITQLLSPEKRQTAQASFNLLLRQESLKLLAQTVGLVASKGMDFFAELTEVGHIRPHRVMISRGFWRGLWDTDTPLRGVTFTQDWETGDISAVYANGHMVRPYRLAQLDKLIRRPDTTFQKTEEH